MRPISVVRDPEWFESHGIEMVVKKIALVKPRKLVPFQIACGRMKPGRPRRVATRWKWVDGDIIYRDYLVPKHPEDLPKARKLVAAEVRREGLKRWSWDW